MKIAVISDLHANLEALRAVLEDIERQGIDKIYCTGDLVGYGPFPNEVIAAVREKGIPSVMGNYDDGVGNMRFICGCDYKDAAAQALGEKSILWSKENTSEANKEFLRNLPLEIRLEAEGKRILLVHGSPERLNEYIHEDTPIDRMAELIAKGDSDILVCGHTHKPFYKVVGDKLLVNAGSVGKPKHGGPEAVYAVLDLGAKTEVEIRKIPYDFEKTAKAIEQSGLPDEFAELIRQGKA